jgi:cell division protein FtsW
VLISIGLIAVAAASPAGANRLSGGGISYQPLYFFYRQLVWIMLAVPVMIAVSMLSKATARRFCLFGAILFTGLLFLVPIVGQEINGAKRWIGVGFTQFQPSEFPEAAVRGQPRLAAVAARQGQQPAGVPLSGICTGLIALLLMQQPNFGETIIFGAAWVMLLTLAGVPMRFLMILGACALGGVVAAYFPVRRGHRSASTPSCSARRATSTPTRPTALCGH